MGVLPTPRKIKIPTGDSNSEASSAPQTDDESGRATPASSVAGGPAGGLQPGSAPTGLASLVSKNIGYRLHMKQGRRSRQRFENEKMLMAIYGAEAEDFEPCRVGEGKSKFEEILEDMAMVDDFINQEEGKYFTIQEEDEEGEEEIDEENVKAEDAYLRISKRLRATLKTGYAIGTLEYIEETLSQSFSEDPTRKFVKEMNSYERLLVHALSKYYCLNSHSIDMEGKRLIKVENPRKTFCKRDPGLAKFLKMRKNRIADEYARMFRDV